MDKPGPMELDAYKGLDKSRPLLPVIITSKTIKSNLIKSWAEAE